MHTTLVPLTLWETDIFSLQQQKQWQEWSPSGGFLGSGGRRPHQGAEWKKGMRCFVRKWRRVFTAHIARTLGTPRNDWMRLWVESQVPQKQVRVPAAESNFIILNHPADVALAQVRRVKKELGNAQREATAGDWPLWAASLVAQRRGSCGVAGLRASSTRALRCAGLCARSHLHRVLESSQPWQIGAAVCCSLTRTLS